LGGGAAPGFPGSFRVIGSEHRKTDRELGRRFHAASVIGCRRQKQTSSLGASSPSHNACLCATGQTTRSTCPVDRSHDTDAREQRWPVLFCDQQQPSIAACHSFGIVFGHGQFGDVRGGGRRHGA